MLFTLRTLLVCILLPVLLILLQIYLSKRESKWPGLVLPIILFILALTFPLNMMAPTGGISAGFLVQMLVVWLLGNIPTIVFSAIYLALREKKRRSKQLDKMNIQDLN